MATKEKLFQRWPVHSAQVRSRLKVPHDYRPWTPVATLSNVPKHTPRVIELLDIGFIHVQKEAQRLAHLKRNPIAYEPKALLKGYWADFSQAVQRKPFGPLGTLHTGSWLYSYEFDVGVPGIGHVALQGFPSNLDFSVFGEDLAAQHSAARKLMGESFSMPVAAQIVTAAFLTPGAPWWKQ